MKVETKINTLLILFIVLFAVLFLRAFFWQVVNGESLSIEADRQHFYELEIPSSRGLVYSSDKSLLVANKESYTLYANLTEIKKDRGLISNDLSSILVEFNPKIATNASELSDLRNELLKKLSLDNAVWVKLGSGLPIKAKDRIGALDINGLSFVSEPTRDYPEASMAAHLLGFVGESKNGKRGYFGIEGYYDKDLAGKSGWLLEEKDAFQRPILLGSRVSKDNINGSDIETTIDRGVQVFVEKFLAEGIQTWGANSGTAIVMNPANGEIIAAASLPSYDPENANLFSNSTLKDPMISDLFEPGSIMKPLIMAAAVNEDLVTPETKCSDCSRPTQIGEYSIHTYNDKYHPNLTMTETLINSDNTGMVFVGGKLGFTKLFDYINRFGFAKKTNIDLEGEVTNKFRPVSQWYPIDQATVTFGQGIAVTPIQMIRAFSILANEGKMPYPKVVRAVISNGTRRETAKIAPIQVLKPETAKIVGQMLDRVNHESELHFALDRMPNLKKYSIAAKSGTAQIPIAGHYEVGRTIGSVIGFAPIEKPRFVVLVKLDSPSVREWGSDTAGPIFYRIMGELFNYYGIPPSN